jgi:hypothetical protein
MPAEDREISFSLRRENLSFDEAMSQFRAFL